MGKFSRKIFTVPFIVILAYRVNYDGIDLWKEVRRTVLV